MDFLSIFQMRFKTCANTDLLRDRCSYNVRRNLSINIARL